MNQIKGPLLDARLPEQLTDLHIHVGGAVAPHILFSLAKEQGFKLPGKTYWEFVDLVTASPEKTHNLDDYLRIMHQWTEKIQSSPLAIERSIYEIISKEYRFSGVSQIELRFNPMKRNLGGERDLDHIIHAALRGMEHAILDYGVKACLIFCLAREFSFEKNQIILEKAIKYRSRGVLGLDLAGPEQHRLELDEEVHKYSQLFARAREAGLMTTVHTGETAHTSAQGVMSALKHLKPHRIGHGIRAATDPEALSMLSDSGVVLEICPTSNLYTRAVRDIDELGSIIRRFMEKKIPLTINTDGPYLLQSHLAQEAILLMDAGVMSKEEVHQCFQVAKKASCIQ